MRVGSVQDVRRHERSQWGSEVDQPIEFVIRASQPDTVDALREYVAHRLSSSCVVSHLAFAASPSAYSM